MVNIFVFLSPKNNVSKKLPYWVFIISNINLFDNIFHHIFAEDFYPLHLSNLH